ncbi:MAG: M48 family metallopeptidase [Chloroflexi bacterium]|nr:M48 family metallopeptidase [Chloroflexota bacterium]
MPSAHALTSRHADRQNDHRQLRRRILKGNKRPALLAVPTYSPVVPRALHRLQITARVVEPRNVIVSVDYDFCECTLLGHAAQPPSCEVSNGIRSTRRCGSGQVTVVRRQPKSGRQLSFDTLTPPGEQQPPLVIGGLTVEVQRSDRRRRTISARADGDRLILQVPAGLSADEERGWAEKLGARIVAARRKRELNSDEDLAARAQQLNVQYFEGRLRFVSVRYVANQQHRFGSCTPSHGTIRISDRLAKMPAWVRDAVLVHELSHLVESNHTARFWKLANRYPLMERARGYLMAVGLDDEGDGP